MNVSVILPVGERVENLRILIPRLIALLDRERLTHEIIVVDGRNSPRESLGSARRGYARAMVTGIADARGDYLLTLDADQSQTQISSLRCGRREPARTSWSRHATCWAGGVLRVHPALDELVSEPGVAPGAFDTGARCVQRLSPVRARSVCGAGTQVGEFRSAGGTWSRLTPADSAWWKCRSYIFRAALVARAPSCSASAGKFSVPRYRCGRSATRWRPLTTTNAPSTA